MVGGVSKIGTGGVSKIVPHTIEVDTLEEKKEIDIEKPALGFGEVEGSKPCAVESSQGSGFNAEPGTGQGIAQPETLFTVPNLPTATNGAETRVGSEPRKTSKGKKEPRRRYGEYQNVLLSDSDMGKLKAEFPDWEERIERLSGYMESTGKSYKNHLATIRNWARSDKNRSKAPQSRSKAISSASENQGWALVVNQGQTAAEAQAAHHRSAREQNAAQEWTEDQLKAFAEMGI